MIARMNGHSERVFNETIKVALGMESEWLNAIEPTPITNPFDGFALTAYTLPPRTKTRRDRRQRKQKDPRFKPSR